jgi:CPA2 family monovalent cation:H+ antiporter-2
LPSVLLVEGAEEFALVREFAIIMVVAGGVVVLFRKLNQPPILGYLIAGLIIGPFTLPTPLITNVESIRLLADLGLVLLLFALGLEFGWRRIRQVGLGVLIIGSLEILTMISLGYWVGRLLGWTTQESIFLGAALSISSSAILVKVLRDSGQLTSIRGQLIVGILVVEDFAAVVLLTLLSGLASTGTAELSDVGSLILKLAIFAAACLALGAVFVPRITRFVAGFGSRETLLLASLAFCFLLALLGQSLGISAAAGAFLIGAVVGDTEEAVHIVEIIEPIRDMFAALFFVSIGMLIDIRLIADHIVPALIISAVFMVCKIVANTAGTFIAGQGGRTPLQVGMGMPQIGEFSLAMMKIGTEQEAIRAFLYQVVAGVTAITSLAYPYIARSADGAAGLLERRTPEWLRRSFTNLSGALQTFQNSLTFDSEFAHRVRRIAVPITINFLIIVVLIATGTFLARSGDLIAAVLGFQPGIIGTIIGLGTLTLCIPSAVAIWRGLQHLTDEVTSHYPIRCRFPALASQQRLRNVLRDAILMLLVFVIALWSIPLIVEILSLGSLALPVALAIIATIGFIALRVLTHMHGQLVTTFSETFVGSTGQATVAGSPPHRAHSAHTGPESAHQAEQEQSAASHGAVPPIIDEGPDTEASAGPVSLGDAEMIALSTVSRDRYPYHNRLNSHQLAWRIVSATEEHGNYRIKLTFREADSEGAEVGEEEIYVDRRGNVRLRQITSWPPGGTRSISRFVTCIGAVLVAILGIGAGILVFLLWGPQ